MYSRIPKLSHSAKKQTYGEHKKDQRLPEGKGEKWVSRKSKRV
jgi:hypothetical protein